MIYFDAAYIAKCYLNEPGADRVREVAYGADGLASCELARLEFASILKRHVREHHVTRREMTAILKEFGSTGSPTSLPSSRIRRSTSRRTGPMATTSSAMPTNT